ncbi:hypothetical protein BpHYR1_029207, partial [Brachionus plicatilis]
AFFAFLGQSGPRTSDLISKVALRVVYYSNTTQFLIKRCLDFFSFNVTFINTVQIQPLKILCKFRLGQTHEKKLGQI